MYELPQRGQRGSHWTRFDCSTRNSRNGCPMLGPHNCSDACNVHAISTGCRHDGERTSVRYSAVETMAIRFATFRFGAELLRNTHSCFLRAFAYLESQPCPADTR